MEPAFTIPLSEYSVIARLSKIFRKKNGYSLYIPVSRQEKDVDFILFNTVRNTSLRFQVKSSRSYINDEKMMSKGHARYNLWFNNFIGRYAPGGADFYVLFGLYPIYNGESSIHSKHKHWGEILLFFSDEEMKATLDMVLTKKEQKPDRFFGIGFDDLTAIKGLRGFLTPRDFTMHLLESKAEDIRNAIEKQ